jgi:DNA/RNA endonuclease YhcR with UshA esterase domain
VRVALRLVVLVPCAVALFAAFAPAAVAQEVVPADSAAQHVGHVVTVEGVVASVGNSRRSGTIFLNFGAPYPNNTFTAVIFRSAAPRFPDALKWEGKRLRVTGTVRVYRGKPEIVLEEPKQVTLER